ncbi:serine palmitoyltransferase component [Terramyces sp. JEL0728]|nr:serine palmitoyltransferase component [Terramyces sp. JEL0728]
METLFEKSILVNDAAKELATHIVIAVNTTFTVANDIYRKVPGSSFFYKYVHNSYQNDPFRLFLELLLVAFMIWYFVAKRYNPANPEIKLTEKEIQDLITEWEPEPLVPVLTDFQKQELERTPITMGQAGLKSKTIDGRERLNFSSYNFLGIMNQESTKEKAIEALRKYGVGTCGPPGFYGTLDVHLELEETIAKFLGTEAAIIYSQGFSCISSVIPAFSKRGDIIVADEGVNFAVQKGIQISRSHIKWFKHNDMDDLERVLKEVQIERKKKKLPLTRQFIIVEGVYANTGSICNLPRLLELKNEYKYRLMVEESMSVGVLGANGRGISEHYGIDASEIDMIISTMSNALASSGGFCAGSKEICEHQRLSGLAYTFSAALPAMLAVAAIEGVKYAESNPQAFSQLSQNSKSMHSALVKGISGLPLRIDGEPGSPIFHVRLTKPSEYRDDDERLLQEVVDWAAKDGILLTRAKYVINQEHMPCDPSIRVSISSGFIKRDIERAANVLRDGARKAFKNRRL